MSALADLLARGTIHIGIAILSAMLVAFVVIGSMIAIGGTGGFTSSPPPDHPAWAGLFILLAVGSVMQWGLLRLHRALISVMDRLASGS